MATEQNQYYGSESISALHGADPYRKKPSTVLGSDDIDGVMHAVNEVVDNAADEVREGHGDKVITKIWKDGSVEVQDFGRGVPMGLNPKEGKYAWELIFCTMYASGKYDSSNYSKSTGLNGIGDTAAQFTSEYMDVESIRDEKVNIKIDKEGNETFELERTRYEIHFKKGYASTELKVERGVDMNTGTRIKFKPDVEVFKGATSVAISLEKYVEKFRKKAMLLKGVKFELQYEGYEPVSIYFENGASDFIDIVCPKRFTKETIKVSSEGVGMDDEENMTPEYKAWCDVEFTFARENTFLEVYHNGSELVQGGSSADGFKRAICKGIEDYARETSKIGKTERIQLKDVEDLITGVVSTNCPGHMTSYVHQTKVAITNKFIGRLVMNETLEAFKTWIIHNKTEADKIISEVMLNKQAREKADAVKKTVLKELSKGINGFRNAPEKLSRCTSKNPEECEIYMVEGDSAAGPAKLARDERTQAILALRGKIINCMKESLERILNSEVIRSIIQSFGCGIELESKYLKDLPKFDIKKLNFNKIIICTDADDDGYHIIVLILVMIYKLMPTLLKEGKVYIVQAPLFMFVIGSGGSKKYRYAYSNSEKDVVLAELEASGVKKNNIVMKRMKGLGEADASVMNETTMDKDNRRLISVEYREDDTEFEVLISSLMGNDVESRKSLIDAYYEEDFGDIDYSEPVSVENDVMEYALY